jgi:hypothetical protein
MHLRSLLKKKAPDSLNENIGPKRAWSPALPVVLEEEVPRTNSAPKLREVADLVHRLKKLNLAERPDSSGSLVDRLKGLNLADRPSTGGSVRTIDSQGDVRMKGTSRPAARDSDGDIHMKGTSRPSTRDSRNGVEMADRPSSGHRRMGAIDLGKAEAAVAQTIDLLDLVLQGISQFPVDRAHPGHGRK